MAQRGKKHDLNQLQRIRAYHVRHAKGCQRRPWKLEVCELQALKSDAERAPAKAEKRASQAERKEKEREHYLQLLYTILDFSMPVACFCLLQFLASESTHTLMYGNRPQYSLVYGD